MLRSGRTSHALRPDSWADTANLPPFAEVAYEAPARQQPNCDLYHCEFPSAMLGVSHHHFKRAGCGLLKSVEQLRISRNYVCAFFRTNTDGTELNGVPVSVCSV